MEPRLSRAEYWILETVAEAQVPLHWLGSESNFIQVLNKAGHGLDRAGIAAALEQMFEAGWLYVLAQSGREFAPTRSQIERQLAAHDLAHDDWVHYGLTALGGAAWEAFACPRWERFVDETFYDPDHDPQDRAVMIGADRMLVYHRFEWMCNVGFHPYCGLRPLAKSAQWETLRPWQATYWKELPWGYRLEYEFVPHPHEPEPRNIAFEFLSHFPRWYDWGKR